MPTHSLFAVSPLQQFISESLACPNLVSPTGSAATTSLCSVEISQDAPWSLARGQVVTLRPRTAGILRVISGRAWATLDVSRYTPLSDSGDHFVALGHDLQLRAGQRVVVESWPQAGDDDIRLQWLPQPGSWTAACWRSGVVEPLRDMVHGIALAGRAGWRLLAGLTAYAVYLVSARSEGTSP
jgi:hypothetical protein